MPRVRDILYRFRPAGSPGGAGTAGVPVDRGADLQAELAPLFAQLADTEAACTALVERARQEASTQHHRAVESARALLTAAQGEAVVERAGAAAAVLRAGEAELASLQADVEDQALELQRRAAARIPEHVARVVAQVRAVANLPPAEGQGAA